MNDKRVFVTGASGFIGRYVVTRLLDDGHSLTLGEAASYPVEWREHPQLRIVKLERLEQEKDFSQALQDVEKIIHLAGLAHIAKADRDNADLQFHNANAVATANLAAAAQKAGVKTFINLSSLATIVENATTDIITDETNGKPATAYGRSKREAETHVRALAKTGMFAVSLRPPLVIGAEAKGNWASLQKLASSGMPLPFGSIRNARSFISVDSVSEIVAHLCSAEWPGNLSGEYCIADPGYLSLPEVLSDLREGMSLAARLLPCPPILFRWLGAATGRRRQMAGLTGDLKVDPSRFMERFQFSPTLPIQEAIRRSGADYRRRQIRRGTI